MHHHPPPQQAYSLIELLIALTILSLTAAFTIPALNTYRNHTNNQVIQMQLIKAIHFAQTEAHARHSLIGLSQSENHSLLIFTDENADGVIHERRQILSVIQMNLHHGKLHMRSYPYYRDYLQFQPDQWSSGDNATIWYCPQPENPPVWAVVINRAGRVRALHAMRDDSLRDSNGRALSCYQQS